jgi:hypothetical protein
MEGLGALLVEELTISYKGIAPQIDLHSTLILKKQQLLVSIGASLNSNDSNHPSTPDPYHRTEGFPHSIQDSVENSIMSRILGER